MPFFHDQDRSSLRRMYVDAWRKHRERRLLEPLETLIVAVIGEHPEYHALLDDAAALTRDWTPEQGATNPFLHMSLHLAVREQVATDRPAGIAAIHATLAGAAGDAHQAEHSMVECLGAALWEAQRNGRAPDETAYLEALRALLPARRR
jgi:hypothetical protein